LAHGRFAVEIAGWAEAGEGVEVVGETGLVGEAAGEGAFGLVNVGAAVHELDRLLEALDGAVEFGGDADPARGRAGRGGEG
jgi:hypothetical protein